MPIRTVVSVDPDKPAQDQPGLHNRWHPDIPAYATVVPNEPIRIETLDWTGGQIRNDDSALDIQNVDLTHIHYLSGPFAIPGAEPGDVLVVELLDLQPRADRPWGFTGVFARENGGGLLDEFYPEAAKAIWDFEGIYASSRHILGVRFPGLIHPGIMGTAPSADVLVAWNKRERDLIAKHAEAGTKAVVAQPPNPANVHAGGGVGGANLQQHQLSAETRARIAREGARTIPGRPENGGNCDIKNLSRGSKTYFPVHVPGAHFSIGDLHFSQGDGEISFCGGIEMAGVVTLKFDVIKGGVDRLALTSPVYRPGPVDPQFGPGRYLTFEGFSVDCAGTQHFLDATVAYRQACLRAIEYLRRFGYSDYQIYLLLSAAPVQGHVAGVVDIPNACTTLGIPLDMFEFDISLEGPGEKRDLGTCAFAR